ncbi:MAG: sigma-54-dependent Fis family transcriptional regulator [Thermoguttaceae bacterium]
MADAELIDRADLERIREDPSVGPVAAELLWLASRHSQPPAFLSEALPVLCAAAGGMFAGLASAAGGRWTLSAQTGPPQPLPADLLAEVSDRESPLSRGDWVAAPLAPRTGSPEFLLIRCKPGASHQQALNALASLAPFVREAIRQLSDRHQTARRVRRLETVLQIVQQWNRTREVEPLLVQMAEAATRLLAADRASIFLWDRRAHSLVAKPALGVQQGEFCLPDDRGVVGRVIQTGRPWRADAASQPELIDHRVDQQLGYQTQSVVCVPLRGQSGELFGAFEVLNQQSGAFSAEDEQALVELAAHAAIALENAQDREQLLSNSRQIAEQAAEQVHLIGQSPAIQALRSIIRRVAETDLAVLILGENGTGKEVVAQSIHYLSRRRDKPFIAVNCAAIPDTLAESELFGHEKGAFTDARETRLGKFQLAAAGTLLLDEIGELSLSGQAKLLRVLEEKVFVRLGGSTPIPTDARVLAATNQNLAEMVRQKRFREDLYFRLNVVTLEIPPLRERREDIPLLAEHFLQDFCKKARRKVPQFTPAARQRLENHPWPGNVRELRNLMERLAYLSTQDPIGPEDLALLMSPLTGTPAPAHVDLTLAEATSRFQTEYIQRAIQQAGGNVSQAASFLGLHRSNLYRKMRQLKMPIPD